MRSTVVLTVLFLAVSLAVGCTAPKAELPTDDLRNMELGELAATYSWAEMLKNPDFPEIRAELLRRNAFTPEEMARARRREVRIGDREEFVLLAWPRWDPGSLPGSDVRWYSSRYGTAWIRAGRVWDVTY